MEYDPITGRQGATLHFVGLLFFFNFVPDHYAFLWGIVQVAPQLIICADGLPNTPVPGAGRKKLLKETQFQRHLFALLAKEDMGR